MVEDEREKPGGAKAGVCPVPLHVNYMHMYRNNMINKQSTDITCHVLGTCTYTCAVGLGIRTMGKTSYGGRLSLPLKFVVCVFLLIAAAL